MRAPEQWQPTKFVMRAGRLRASTDRTQVAPASRFVADRLASRYHDLLRRHARGRLLDLGAGSVPLFEAYRDVVDAVTCVDWAHSAHNGLHIDVQADLNGPLPLESSAYDTVLMTDVLEHVLRPHTLIDEVSRVLAPSGKLLLAAPFLYWIHEAPHDYARYTEFMLRALCEGAGLTVCSIEPTGGSPEVILDIVGKHLSWSNSLAAVHGRIADWVTRLPEMDAASRYSARWFPLGFAVVAERRGEAAHGIR